jgi:hypothetical protein
MPKDPIDRILDAIDILHGRITEVVTTVACIDERTSHMPTCDDMNKAIDARISKLEAKRRWSIGIAVIVISTVVTAAVAFIQLG